MFTIITAAEKTTLAIPPLEKEKRCLGIKKKQMSILSFSWNHK